MDWDNDYHDESEFYYPEELENGPENVNINTSPFASESSTKK
jgi:hypothetical protein